MIDAKEKTLRDFVHEAIVPLIEDVLVKKLYQALEVVVSEIKPPRKEWVSLDMEDVAECLVTEKDGSIKPISFARKLDDKLREKNR